MRHAERPSRRPASGRRRALRRIALLSALAGLLAAWSALAAGSAAPVGSAADDELVERGRELFLQGCSSCHGEDARGRPGVAPTLHGSGALAADFYLSTGRMPLDYPEQEPVRAEPRYPRSEIDALVAYVGSLGGPAIPEVDPAAGDLADGQEAFTTNCAGCHQIVARGGVVTGAFAPALTKATPRQVAEAVRMGPYLMPRFSRREIDDETLDSIARYVEYAKDPEDEGGWAIGNLGPIPEGMVAWLIAIAALLVVARVIGERARS